MYRKAFFILGHSDENLNTHDNDFLVPPNCSVTVKTKCGLIDFRDSLMVAFNKFVKADERQLLNPKQNKSYKDKVFLEEGLTTYKANVPCPPLNIVLSSYSVTTIRRLPELLCCNYPDNTIILSGVIDHRSPLVKRVKTIHLLDINDILKSILNIVLSEIPTEGLLLKHVPDRVANKYLSRIFGSDYVTNHLLLDKKVKKESYDKVNASIVNHQIFQKYITKKIITFINANHQKNDEDFKAEWHSKIAPKIYNVFELKYNYIKWPMYNDDPEYSDKYFEETHLTIEDLCNCFPGDYYSFLCRNIPVVTNILDGRLSSKVKPKNDLNELKAMSLSTQYTTSRKLPPHLKKANVDTLVKAIFTQGEIDEIFAATYAPGVFNSTAMNVISRKKPSEMYSISPEALRQILRQAFISDKVIKRRIGETLFGNTRKQSSNKDKIFKYLLSKNKEKDKEFKKMNQKQNAIATTIRKIVHSSKMEMKDLIKTQRMLQIEIDKVSGSMQKRGLTYEDLFKLTNNKDILEKDLNEVNAIIKKIKSTVEDLKKNEYAKEFDGSQAKKELLASLTKEQMNTILENINREDKRGMSPWKGRQIRNSKANSFKRESNQYLMMKNLKNKIKLSRKLVKTINNDE
jgi:hypothetical protein